MTQRLTELMLNLGHSKQKFPSKMESLFPSSDENRRWGRDEVFKL